jgi:hypothetical protein
MLAKPQTKPTTPKHDGSGPPVKDEAVKGTHPHVDGSGHTARQKIQGKHPKVDSSGHIRPPTIRGTNPRIGSSGPIAKPKLRPSKIDGSGRPVGHDSYPLDEGSGGGKGRLEKIRSYG